MILLAAPVIPAAVVGLAHPHAPRWEAVSLRGAEILPDVAIFAGADVVWVDARANALYRKDHIPGALPLSKARWYDEIGDVIDAVSGTGKAIVVYSDAADPDAALQVAYRLREQMRLPRVFAMQGGIEAWRQEARWR